ncbi:MAG: polysaccharide deacetylase family protein [Cellvibrionaceae bacterium]
MQGKFIPIFMMHRFECKDSGIEGHSVEMVEKAFEFLRKSKVDIISVEDAIFLSKQKQTLERPVVAFSIDDGYWDHYEIGLDIFKKYDCPATYFVSTGIVDGGGWMWDSKLMFLIDEAIKQGKLKNIIGMFQFSFLDKEEVVEAIVKQLKSKEYSLIQEKINEIAIFLGIELPASPPDKYRFMSWGDIRKAEMAGMRIGPHSKNHYILSSLSGEQAKYEIQSSWSDLKEKVEKPSPVFCYPVGKPEDYGVREKEIVQSTDMVGAVTASPGGLGVSGGVDYYEIPRYSFPDSLVDFKQYTTWIEEYKHYLKPSC